MNTSSFFSHLWILPLLIYFTSLLTSHPIPIPILSQHQLIHKFTQGIDAFTQDSQLPIHLSAVFKKRQTELFVKRKLSTTLRQPNIAPENGWLENYVPFGKVYFQGLCPNHLTPNHHFSPLAVQLSPINKNCNPPHKKNGIHREFLWSPFFCHQDLGWSIIITTFSMGWLWRYIKGLEDQWLIVPWLVLVPLRLSLWDPFQMAEMGFKWFLTTYVRPGMIFQVVGQYGLVGQGRTSHKISYHSWFVKQRKDFESLFRMINTVSRVLKSTSNQWLLQRWQAGVIVGWIRVSIVSHVITIFLQRQDMFCSIQNYSPCCEVKFNTNSLKQKPSQRLRCVPSHWLKKGFQPQNNTPRNVMDQPKSYRFVQCLFKKGKLPTRWPPF